MIDVRTAAVDTFVVRSDVVSHREPQFPILHDAAEDGSVSFGVNSHTVISRINFVGVIAWLQELMRGQNGEVRLEVMLRPSVMMV
jgi:hypothetical protein